MTKGRTRVGLGFTVFSDLTAPDRGLAVLDAIGPDLWPETIKGMGQSRPLSMTGPEDWLKPWAVRAKISGAGQSHDTVFGSDWSRRKAPQGFGMVSHGQLRGNIRPSTLILEHTYSPNVDWLGTFTRLCDLLQPAYAMAHLFTPEQVEAGMATGFITVQTGQVFRRHKRPPEEYYATDKPPFYDCALPQLAWANWFGTEWEGRADAVLSAAAVPGPLLKLSDRIEVIAEDHAGFAATRARLEPFFPAGIIIPRPKEERTPH